MGLFLDRGCGRLPIDGSRIVTPSIISRLSLPPPPAPPPPLFLQPATRQRPYLRFELLFHCLKPQNPLHHLIALRNVQHTPPSCRRPRPARTYNYRPRSRQRANPRRLSPLPSYWSFSIYWPRCLQLLFRPCAASGSAKGDREECQYVRLEEQADWDHWHRGYTGWHGIVEVGELEDGD